MNPKTLRRLAADHASLHKAGLPPNYLFPPNSADSLSELTHLDVLLAGPVGTPYSCGVFRLRLEMPATYPSAPPTASFRTRIFHPNVEESTGAVCVDTLKRDWSSALTLRDVLVTISCLLIQPNPASALNAEAGRLVEEDWRGFERRARLLTEIHAAVPEGLRNAVEEAKRRGEERDSGEKGKGKAKVTRTSKKVVRDEDGENSGRVKRVLVSAEQVDSDPEADWIPQPPRATKPFALSSDNALGIKVPGTPKLQKVDSMDIDEPRAREGVVQGGSFESTSTSSIGDTFRTAHTSQPPASLSDSNSNGTSQTSFLTAATPTQLVSSTSTSSTATPSNLPSQAHNQSFPFPLGPATLENRQPQPSDPTLSIDFTWSWIDPSSTLGKVPRTPESMRREKSEMRRLKAAGGSLKRYNRGNWGPRKGLKRL